MKTIGLFGGTFDPVHCGHEAMARAALVEGVDHLIVMPCHRSPFKLEAGGFAEPTSGEHRWQMLNLVFGDEPRIEVSRHEIEGPPISYTWQTLEFLWGLYPEDRLCLILGQDQYELLSQWARIEVWGSRVDFLIFGRGTDYGRKSSDPGWRLRWSSRTIPDVSSTMVREALAEGEEGRNILHPKVRDYIHRQGLYR
ncbi:MAG: nicotinate (nicotinamide) nucleotide adenylyltransferase [Blastochloris sp.]|nr:nicotinate (nicotinamide) nucleotide adenylyltransferase [Blastochloris sp.]